MRTRVVESPRKAVESATTAVARAKADDSCDRPRGVVGVFLFRRGAGGGMSRFFWICFGGAVGTGARYLLSGWILSFAGPSFPWGTLAVNATGSFLLGVITQVALTTRLLSPTLRLALSVVA